MVRKHIRNPVLAAILSLVVPGLGQIYAGKSERGVAILVAGIIVGTLALIWQTLFVTATPSEPFFLPYRISLTIYAAVFWVWQVVDGYQQAKT
jgi:TM2 domain-containing membrane protein YozV